MKCHINEMTNSTSVCQRGTNIDSGWMHTQHACGPRQLAVTFIESDELRCRQLVFTWLMMLRLHFTVTAIRCDLLQRLWRLTLMRFPFQHCINQIMCRKPRLVLHGQSVLIMTDGLRKVMLSLFPSNFAVQAKIYAQTDSWWFFFYCMTHQAKTMLLKRLLLNQRVHTERPRQMLRAESGTLFPACWIHTVCVCESVRLWFSLSLRCICILGQMKCNSHDRSYKFLSSDILWQRSKENTKRQHV